jgi:hypothetical protein
MKKNKHSQEGMARSERRSDSERDRNSTLLILAILFFLLSLWVLARASGFDLMRAFGLPSSRQNPGTTQPGGAGTRGPAGTSGGTGAGGGAGTNTGTTPTDTNGDGLIDDLDVNVKTDTGVEVDAGVDQGQLYVDPKVNPNAQGGTGAEGSVNDTKVIDTRNLLN